MDCTRRCTSLRAMVIHHYGWNPWRFSSNSKTIFNGSINTIRLICAAIGCLLKMQDKSHFWEFLGQCILCSVLAPIDGRLGTTRCGVSELCRLSTTRIKWPSCYISLKKPRLGGHLAFCIYHVSCQGLGISCCAGPQQNKLNAILGHMTITQLAMFVNAVENGTII